MSLLTSLLNLAVVVGAGWFTIYYLIPKIESGELGLPGAGGGTKDEEEQIPEDIADAADVGDETPPPPDDDEPAPLPPEEKKKPPYDPKRGMAGKGESKKKKAKTKKEFRIIEYLSEMRGY